MADQPTRDDFPAELPRGVWAKKLPWKLGTIIFVRSLMVDNIHIKFDFEISIFFPITFFLEFTHREFHQGSRVPEHRDAFEPIYGCAATLLLRKSGKGGEFKCDKTLLRWRRLTVFNGSRHQHSVSQIEEGSRDLLQGNLYFAPWPAPIRSVRPKAA